MCGIGGALFQQRSEADAASLMKRLAHRGPDGHGAYLDDNVMLVHTRLALVDPAHGQQPLRTPDGRYVLVVNGEVYGHRRLRAQLIERGAVFRTSSDSEVLLWSLVHHGIAALDDIEGEYAFCLWDTVARTAWLGRDPLGVKPLVMMRKHHSVLFASEAQALRALTSLEVDLDVVARTFACPPWSGGASGADALPYRCVESVPAGVVLEVTEGGTRTRRIEQRSVSRGIAHDLKSAVHDRLDADVEIGAFLSGGVDSSAIVACALQAKERMRCVSVGYDGATRVGSIVTGDDAPFVDDLERRWPIDVVRISPSTTASSLRIDGRLASASLDALFRGQDRIAAWEQELSQRSLAEAASHTLALKAVLVGDAADETHAGYAFALTEPVCAHPRAFVDSFGGALRYALLRPEHRHAVDDVVDDALTLAEQHGTPWRGDVRAQRRAMMTLMQHRWLPRLLHNGDLHTMAFGLEARVPFSDGRLLAAAAATDIDDAYRDSDDVPEKHALRQALRGLVPDAILARRKSALPRDEAAGPLYQRLLRDADRRARIALLCEPSEVDRFVAEHDPQRDDVRAVMFSLLSIDGFLRHHGEAS